MLSQNICIKTLKSSSASSRPHGHREKYATDKLGLTMLTVHRVAKKIISKFWILCFQIAVCVIVGAVAADALAADVTLAWDPNTESDLAGYRIHHGTASGSYSVHIDVRNVTTYTVTGLTAGQTYYFVATAYNDSGSESGYSDSVSYTVPTVNVAPSTPATPSGPSSALVNTAVTFSTSAADPNGDSLQYRYDWGGGVLSNWGSASQSRSWTGAGQFAVRAQARDNQGAQSGWSSIKTLTITQSTVPAVVDTDRDVVPNSNDAFPNDRRGWTDANGNGFGDNADASATVATGPAQAPAAPLLVSPANDAVVGTMLVLETGGFRTTAAGATHAKTRWQVFRDEDDACVLDIQSAEALTNLTLTRLVLDEGTPYYWRAQFIDSKSTASAWSDYEYFSIQSIGADLNVNGIPDAQEVDSTVDLDRDGVPDYLQTTIKSVKMEGTNVQVGVSIKEAPSVLKIESVESEDPRASDLYPNNKPQSMPFGILNIKIAVAKPGDQAVVRLYFSEPLPAMGKWYEYDTAADRWIDFSDFTEFSNDRMSATLTLRDGGAEDSDGVANGVIIDPGGIGMADSAIPNDSAPRSGSGGSGGGCLIGTVYDSKIYEPISASLCLLGFLTLLCLWRINGHQLVAALTHIYHSTYRFLPNFKR